MSETTTDRVTPLKRDRERGFTDQERTEIITRLQVVENVASGVSAQLALITQELFPEAEVGEGEQPRTVNMLKEVHFFCQRLGQVLDALGSNPMFAAMMPAEMAQGMVD